MGPRFLLLLFSAATAAAGRVEQMTLCEDKCESGCRTYDVPLGECYSPRRLFPDDPQWGDLDVLDTCDDDGAHLNRSFFASGDGSCADKTDGFRVPAGPCVGPFGAPRPWGRIACPAPAGGPARRSDAR